MPVIHKPPPSRREEPRHVPHSLDAGALPLFSVIVPAYNEGATLRESVEHLLDALEEVGEPYEVLIVNDGSRDETPQVAEALAAAEPRVRALHHDRNRGLGAALRTAIAAARGEYIVGSPADSPLDAPQIRIFHEAMEAHASYAYLPGSAACDIAVGFRPKRAGYKAWMQFGSAVYRWMLRIAFWTWLRDFNWICMYRRRVFEVVSIEFDSFVVLPEILVKAKRAGFSLRQVPCPMKPRKVGKGTVGRPQILFKAFVYTVRLWLRVTFGSAGRAGARGMSKEG